MKTKNIFIILAAVIFPLVIVCSCKTYLLPTYKLMKININKEDADDLMQEFVINISEYAKAYAKIKRADSGFNFLIVPQNAPELAFYDCEIGNGNECDDYIDAIDGIGLEELFFNSKAAKKTDLIKLQAAKHLKTNYGLPVFVSDYVNSPASSYAYLDSINLNETDNGFIAYPRVSGNYHYLLISSARNVNTISINNLTDAKNYLYLISTNKEENKTTDTRQKMINEIKSTNFDIVIMDLYHDEDKNNFEPSQIAQLKTKANGTKRLVLAYINIGAAEMYRYYWQGNPPYLVKPYGEGYTDEYLVGYWTDAWQKIIFNNGIDNDPQDNSYIKQIIDAGFDGIYLDNVASYEKIFEK